METEKAPFKVESISISEPYVKRANAMICRVKVTGHYGTMDLVIEPELIQPIIDVVAAAIADAGRQMAEGLQRTALEVSQRAQPVIEHAPAPRKSIGLDGADV